MSGAVRAFGAPSGCRGPVREPNSSDCERNKTRDRLTAYAKGRNAFGLLLMAATIRSIARRIRLAWPPCSGNSLPPAHPGEHSRAPTPFRHRGCRRKTCSRSASALRTPAASAQKGSLVAGRELRVGGSDRTRVSAARGERHRGALGLFIIACGPRDGGGPECPSGIESQGVVMVLKEGAASEMSSGARCWRRTWRGRRSGRQEKTRSRAGVELMPASVSDELDGLRVCNGVLRPAPGWIAGSWCSSVAWLLVESVVGACGGRRGVGSSGSRRCGSRGRAPRGRYRSRSRAGGE